MAFFTVAGNNGKKGDLSPTPDHCNLEMERPDPNSAFTCYMSDEEPWIEVFHSRPSWNATHISFSTNNSDPWVPFGSYKHHADARHVPSKPDFVMMKCTKMIDESSTKEGFRVFRTQALTLLFKVANGSHALVDDNNSACYYIPSPGRYVVESGTGCRRVGDAQICDCLRPIRPNDRYIHITFSQSKNWRECFIDYLVNGTSNLDWTTLPMQPSAVIQGAWTVVVNAPLGAECKFFDGTFHRKGNEFIHAIRLPGRYRIEGYFISYEGPSPADLGNF